MVMIKLPVIVWNNIGPHTLRDIEITFCFPFLVVRMVVFPSCLVVKRVVFPPCLMVKGLPSHLIVTPFG